MANEAKIYILVGPVHTGKSSAIRDWLKAMQLKAAGFLHLGNPKVLWTLQDNECQPLEKSEVENENDVSIGKYIFEGAAFLQMNDILYLLAQKPEPLIIVDEIGKLELKEQGIHRGIVKLIDAFPKMKNTQIIFVVRDFLLEEVVEKYNLKSAQIISKTGLGKI